MGCGMEGVDEEVVVQEGRYAGRGGSCIRLGFHSKQYL